jgi:hypothetical protein
MRKEQDKRVYYKQQLAKASKELANWLQMLESETPKDSFGNFLIWPGKLQELLKLKGRVTRWTMKVQQNYTQTRFPYPPALTLEEAQRRISYWKSVRQPQLELYEYLGWRARQYEFFVRTGQLPRFKESQIAQ